MQYLSHNMPCECNTRRGQSNRLKTNLLHFAALLLLALAPRVGWAQAQQTESVDNKEDFRAALEDPDVDTIIITDDFTLGKAHIAGNGSRYGSVYRVIGEKTIIGQNKTIYRGDEYLNTSICIENGASLRIENLTFDGRKSSTADTTSTGILTNYGPMIALPDKRVTEPDDPGVPENGQLVMIGCTIRNCKSKRVSDADLKNLDPRFTNTNYYWCGLHSNGGAAISFMPTREAVENTNTNNRIHLEDCVFENNKIVEGIDRATEIGGAIIIGGNEAMGGEIKNCTIQGNYAYLYGGGIYFTGALPNDPDRKFEFTGHNLIDGNSTIQSGGGMAIQGGYVVINGKMDITNNRSNGTGGGIYAEISENEAAGSLIFRSTAEVDISYNTAATGNGGGIYMGTWDGNTSSNSPPLQANKLTVRAEKPTMDIHDNTAAYGGGISVGLYSPTSQNQNKYWAADIFFESASNAVDASSSINIYDNKATYSEKPMGGGIFVRQNPHNSNNSNEHSTRFTKCIVTNNYADNTSTGTGQGGGVALFNICQARFDECRIYDNHTTKNDGLGGGVYVEEASRTPKNLFNNCLIYENGKLDTIDNNQVYTQKGGGAYVNGPATFKGCNIYDNYASNEGGGLFMTHELAVLDGSQVHENNSSKGGGIHITNGDIVGQSGPNKIYENTASNGGGIYYIDGRIRKASHANYVYDNTAAQNGGGVFVHPQSNTAKTISHLFVGTDDASATNKGNRAVNGGGIYVKCETTSPSITFEACSIVHNKLQSNGNTINRGGGVFMSDNNDSGAYSYTVNLTGGTIIDDNKALDGGGVYIDQQGHTLTLKLIQTTLSKNEATSNGGGIYNNKGIVLCDDNDSFTFDDNKALNGGGIYNQEGTLTLQGTDGEQIFKKNKAVRVGNSGGNGGGMFLNGGTVLLKNCDIGITNKVNGNEANNGGGIYFNAGDLKLNNTRVSYNKATTNGGGIYQNSSKALILQGNTTFFDNEALVLGGGLLNNTQRTTEIESATFTINKAGLGGGGIYNKGGTVNGANSITHFVGNEAIDGDGGGIHNFGTLNLDGMGNKTFTGNKAQNGGGIYNRSGKTGDNSCIFEFTMLEDNDTVNEIKGKIKIVWAKYGGGTAPNSVRYIDDTIVLYGFDKVHKMALDIPYHTRCHLFVIYKPAPEEEESYDGTNPVLKVRLTNMNSGTVLEGELKDKEVPMYGNNNKYYWKTTTANDDRLIKYPGCYTYSFHQLNTEPGSTSNINGVANLSNCTIGGSAANANKATAGHGGGIYIKKGSTVTMTVENKVTHNTATGNGGGVYKDGTLKVKDMVTVTDNTAGTAKGEGATEGEEAAEEATEEAAEP